MLNLPTALNFVVLAACLVPAVIIDVRSHRIPNLLCAVALVAGLSLQIVATGFAGLWLSLGGALTGAVILLPFYLSGGMGAGDVKLMAAVGAFLGASGAIFAALTTLLVGGAVGGGMMLLKQICLWGAANEIVGFRNGAAVFAWEFEFPYAGAIAIGAIAGSLVNWLHVVA
jgi:prepilin peptidase CpaA